MNKKIIDYSEQNVYVGIDVHKKTYVITARCNKEIVDRCTMQANPSGLIRYLQRRFKNALINTVYEAGFSGFYLHRCLNDAGFKSILVNPGSVKKAPNEKVKTDKRDSKKLAKDLENHELNGIYIPPLKQELARLLSRTREQVLRKRTRVTNNIKSRLHQFGLINKDIDDTPMSNRYIKEIQSWELAEELKTILNMLIEEWRFLNRQLNEILKKLREQAKKDCANETIYRSAPGIGFLSARSLSNELGDLSLRFKNERQAFSFTGLTPGECSSGEDIRRGHITRQGSGRLRWLLVEAAWRAIKKDKELNCFFENLAQKRGKKKAIVAVARKLIGRLRACFRLKTTYTVIPLTA